MANQGLGRLYCPPGRRPPVDEALIEQVIRFSLAGFLVMVVIAIGVIVLTILI